MSCKIYLDNYQGQYFPGSLVQGRVICNFSSETTLRGIKVRFKGEEHTEWLGEESYYNSETNKHETRQALFTGHNDVFFQEILLYGTGQGSSSLPMGQHIYPFSITLPAPMPASYNFEHGYISYKIQAIVDIPMRTDYEDTTVFVVTSPLDNNNLPQEFQNPQTLSDEKTVCCWCCASGPISLDVEIPKRVLMPGEAIIIKARLQNLSNVNIERLVLELTQDIKAEASTPSHDSKSVHNDLCNITDVGVGAHGDHTYELRVEVPQNIMVPNFQNCKLFSAQHQLKIKCELPSMHSDLDVATEVYLGSPSTPFNQPNQYPPQNIGPPTNFYPPPGGDYNYQPPPPQGQMGFQPPGFVQPAPGGGFPPPAGYPAYPPPNNAYPPYPGGPPAGSLPTAPAMGPAPYSKAQEAASSEAPPSYDEAHQFQPK